MKLDTLRNVEYLGDSVSVGIDEFDCTVLVKDGRWRSVGQFVCLYSRCNKEEGKTSRVIYE